MQVVLVGEGKHELGNVGSGRGGFLHEVLDRCHPGAWSAAHSLLWKDVARKLDVGSAGHGKGLPETKALRRLGHHLNAVRERGELHVDAVVLLRDADGEGRRKDVEAGSVDLRSMLGTQVQVAAGVPEPCLEGWVLALAGKAISETRSSAHAKQVAEQHGVGDLDAMTSLVRSADLDAASKGSKSFGRWLVAVRALSPTA